MKKALAVLLVAVLATLSPAASFAACPPDGPCPIYLCNWFDWISNSSLRTSSCWTFSGNVVFKSDPFAAR